MRLQRGRPWRRLLLALLEPGMHAVLVYRFGHWTLGRTAMLRWPLSALYYPLALAIRVLWGIELPRRTCIGPGLYIGHFGGIVVSSATLIGRNCSLSHGVTIGLGNRGASWGVPHIGEDVYIGPGACLYGPIRIGDNVKIGANTVVSRDVPDNAVVALDPGFRIVSMKGNRRPAAVLTPARSDTRRSASTG